MLLFTIIHTKNFFPHYILTFCFKPTVKIVKNIYVMVCNDMCDRTSTCQENMPLV